MAASHDARRDPWVALGALAVGDARAQYTAGLDPPQTASITSRAKVPRPLVSLHLRVQPARPGPPHTTSRPVAPPRAASTGSPPYTNRLGPRRADAARVPRHRRQRSNARAETIVAAPTTRGGELRYVRRGSAADDWLEHRALLPGSVCTRARVPHGAFFGCAPRIHVRAVTFRRSGPPARRGGRARAGLHLVRYSAKIGGFYNMNKYESGAQKLVTRPTGRPEGGTTASGGAQRAEDGAHGKPDAQWPGGFGVSQNEASGIKDTSVKI